MKNRKSFHLPVLLYHDINEGEVGSRCSVYLYNLSLQFYYLKSNGFTAISVRQLIDYIETGAPLPEKPVLLTFNGGFKSIRTCLYPLLIQLNMKATAFLVPSLINSQDSLANTYLSLQEIKGISTDYVEWGFHSYDHCNYNKLTTVQVAHDVRLCINWFHLYQIPFAPILAFPFGSYPKYNWVKRGKFFLALQLVGIKLSFGKGSSSNLVSKKTPVLVERIEITGKETIQIFAKYLEEGKRKSLYDQLNKLIKIKFKQIKAQAAFRF